MRRILGRALVGSAIALAMTAPIMSQNTFAQSTSVDAWATIGTIHPAAGCTVDVAIEVRDGGAALSGANVALEVSLDDSGEVISTDSAATNDSGVAYLTYDTSAAGADAKGWLSLSINGGYVGGQSIWTDGDSCSGSQAVVDFSGDVPSVSVAESTSSSSSESSSSAVIIPNVSAYQQQRPLSCEYASLAVATGALGNWISEYDFDNVVGWSENPHWGYRGDINGTWGNTTDYGVYAEALVPALNSYGFQGDVFYGGVDTLKASIDAGSPTLVWLGFFGDQSIYPTTADGVTYQVTAGMHVEVAYGYDEGGVYLSNVGNGSYVYYDWATFTSYWDVMDQMALAVHW